MSHTPGPWKVHPRNSYVVVSCGNEIASIADGHGLDEAVANGELIAAAPDLLAALKEMRDAATAAMRVVADLDAAHLLGTSAATRQQRFIDELKFAGVTNGFGVRANAAIAKAEGK